MRLIDADQFGVVSFQGKSEDFIEGALFILEKIDEAPTIERPHEKWEYLKEHITEMRDADGESILTQKQICQFILNLMGVIEKEGDENG